MRPRALQYTGYPGVFNIRQWACHSMTVTRGYPEFCRLVDSKQRFSGAAASRFAEKKTIWEATPGACVPNELRIVAGQSIPSWFFDLSRRQAICADLHCHSYRYVYRDQLLAS